MLGATREENLSTMERVANDTRDSPPDIFSQFEYDLTPSNNCHDKSNNSTDNFLSTFMNNSKEDSFDMSPDTFGIGRNNNNSEQNSDNDSSILSLKNQLQKISGEQDSLLEQLRYTFFILEETWFLKLRASKWPKS